MRFSMLIPASLLLAGAAMPLPLAAQAMVQPLPGTTDADKLADLVRELGRNPRDLSALIEAGDLSAKLGDTTAAAALYKRASQIDPNNARVKAGIARILVNGEHPGEALRYFDQAERAGLSPTMFGDDRGLAYDLIGEQERAQRDYRLALARAGQGNEDEVRRRYALSLGISGRKDEALQQIDALLRKSDRGAWRARAFILAMNGDAAGANRIATTMMPAGMGTGLAAFFTRLPTLSPADRAFAVHFGEVTPTPQRLADARLVPTLPALAPDLYAHSVPVQVAAQTVAPQSARDRRRGRQSQQAQPATTYAQAAQQPAPITATAPSSAAPTQVAQVAPSTRPLAPTANAAPAATAPVQVAQASTLPTAGYARAVPPSSMTAAVSPVGAAPLASPVPLTQPLPAPVASRPVVDVAATSTPAAAANLAVAAGTRPVVPTDTPVALAAVPATPAPTSAAAANNVVRAQTAGATGTAQVAPAQLAAASPAIPPRVESGDSILARIVANISIPAAELGVAPMPETTVQAGTTATIDAAAVAAERNAAAQERRERAEAQVDIAPTRPATRIRRASVQTAVAATEPKPRGRGAAIEAPDEEARVARSRRRGAAREQVAVVEEDAPVTSTRRGTRAGGKKAADGELAAGDGKKGAAKTKTDAKPLADRKVAAEEKATRAEPERHWIQVAGGATEGDLRKAWASTKSKSSLLAGRAGYSTPLRATNRVVTGPFKTQAEAQTMVNKLAKQGVSAFTFTSEPGQKMTKLDGK